MNDLKFTVVIPLYNKGAYISRAICSVFAQTCQEFELIIIDDGSTDGGAEVVKNIDDPRVTLIHQENAGVSAARNRGIEAARADLVAFLDADDEWHPTFLETIFRLRIIHPEAGLYSTSYEILTPSGKRIMPKFSEIPSPPWEGILPSYFRVAALSSPPVCASAVCIPRPVIMNIGSFALGKRMGEDLDLWGRIALRYPVCFSYKIGAIYHQESQNRACTKFFPDDEHPFIETVKTFSSKEELFDQWANVELYMIRLSLENARQQVIAGNYKRARQLLAGKFKFRFIFRSTLWGTKLNYLTYIVWRIKWKVLDFGKHNVIRH